MAGRDGLKMTPSGNSREDRLTYVGHATTLLRLAGTTLLTDPAFRRRIGPLRRHGTPVAQGLAELPDAVLISHLHRDHLDLPSLRLLPPRTTLMVPRGAGALVSKLGVGRVQEISPGEQVDLGRLQVTAVPASHDSGRDPWGSRRAQPLGFLLEAEDRRAYFAGDTDLFAEMSALGPIDLALLPVWGWGPALGPGHLDPLRAAQALTMLRPRLAVPIHWGTFYPVGFSRLRPDRLTRPPLEFAEFAAELAPDVEVRVLEPGATSSLSAGGGS